MPDSRFRRYAAECMARAHEATAGTARVVWLQLAQQWLKKAESPGHAPPVSQQQQQVQAKLADDSKPSV